MQDSTERIPKQKGLRDMAQGVESQLSKQETLSLKPPYWGKKKLKQKGRQCGLAHIVGHLPSKHTTLNSNPTRKMLSTNVLAAKKLESYLPK
jgi:hypothetical protein